MNKILESAGIALDAIWASKLRSLMTVLGNIVAVTSIIAVVSLIQGLNASVTAAIMNQAGADSFSIQQFPVTRSDDEFEAVRGNPRITLQDAVPVDVPGDPALYALVILNVLYQNGDPEQYLLPLALGGNGALLWWRRRHA